MARVLIVEDDPDLALLLSDILLREGHSSKIAGDAVQAMTVAPKLKPDLIILDFMLPGGGGPAVHKALRADPANAGLPVILLTSVPEEQVNRTMDLDGRTYYLGKPYRREELLAVLAQALLDKDERAAR